MHELTGQLNVKLINCHLDELLACILCSIEVESLSHCLAWHAMYRILWRTKEFLRHLPLFYYCKCKQQSRFRDQALIGNDFALLYMRATQYMHFLLFRRKIISKFTTTSIGVCSVCSLCETSFKVLVQLSQASNLNLFSATRPNEFAETLGSLHEF